MTTRVREMGSITCRFFLVLSLFGAGGTALAQGGGGGVLTCPPPAGTESNPATEGTFLVVPLQGGNPMSFTATGPTAVLHSAPDANRNVPIEIVELSLSGTDPIMGPFQVTQSQRLRSVGLASGFDLVNGECDAFTSFFDVFVEINFPALNVTYVNQQPIHLVGNGPIPIPHVRGFSYVQQDPAGAGPPVLVDQATGRPFGTIQKTVHTVPPPQVCPCFPPAGVDRMYSRLGHTLDIPGIGICAPAMFGPLSITRSDPFIDPTTGLCCINLTPTSFDLWGWDPVCGTVHITLNPLHPSTGLVCGKTKGACFPADSCLNLFVKVLLVDRNISYVNCDPIQMCCTISALPPYDCPYAVQNAPISLYKELATADVCGVAPRPVPAAFIREAVHTPEPPPVCPPPPKVQTSFSTAQVLLDTPQGSLELALSGPTTTSLGQAAGDGTIPTEIVSMELVGALPTGGQVTLRKNPDLQRPSRGVAQNCRLDDRFGDVIADSFFDVFVQVELPDPRNPTDTLQLENPIPVRMVGSGIPLCHNLILPNIRPLQLQQANQGEPTLVDSAGKVLGRIVNTVHQLQPPPPPRCDCFPRAGIDRFRSSLIHSIDVPGIGLIRADCEGPVVVVRGDPRIDPATGLCVIDTRIEEMLLNCEDPLAGPICISLNKKRPSVGTVTQLSAGSCFPAHSCFDIFIRVELKKLGIVLVNCEPVKMCCDVTALPPFGCPYGIQNPGLPLYREIDDPADPKATICSSTARPAPVGFIREATHTPQPPAKVCECYPPAGDDVMNTNLWHEIVIPGVGTCRAHLSGTVVVSRGSPFVDPTTGKCCIKTVMRSMKLTGADPICGNITITLNPAHPTTGLICEQVPNTCFPADSFFDVFISVTTDKAGTFVNCQPAHMQAVIHSLPPWNSFYNLELEGLPLYRFNSAQDVCSLQPLPAPAASIGKALHVPRQPCNCFTPGHDIMDSILAHKINVPGIGVCSTPLHGRVEVDRHEPYLNAEGLCCQDTEMTFLELSGTDPVCGPIKISLNPDRASTGFICQKTRESCFPVESCFQVFVRVTFADGKVVENCEPAIMCCMPNTLPPYDCAYLLSFGDHLPLYPAGVCGLPPSQRPPPVAEILAQSVHTPKPCPALSAACTLSGNSAVITVTPDPNCPCDTFQVKRDDGVTLAVSAASPLTFTDPNPCPGPHTYTVQCNAGGALSSPISVTCPPCQPPVCKVQDPICTLEAGGVRIKWSTDPAGCCARILITRNGVTIAVLAGTATEYLAAGPCEPAGGVVEYCVICLDQSGKKGTPVCCKLTCPTPCAGTVHDLTCTNLEPLATGIRLRWSIDPDCPCDRVAILRDGVKIAVVSASDETFLDPIDCPSSGPVVNHTYCVVCIDQNEKETSPRVCCKVVCGGDPCPVHDLRDVSCLVAGDPPVVTIKWSLDPACPCQRVRISRDGVVIAELPAGAAGGSFEDPCGPGEHRYCVVCIDAAGNVTGEPKCCTVTCPPGPVDCNCPPAGVDTFRSSLIHLIDVPGFGKINASMQGPVVVRRGDPFIDITTGKCCIKTLIESMELFGNDVLVGPIKISLNPCRPSTGTICQDQAGQPNCFPALSCFDIYIRVEMPAIGLILSNCEPIKMCCEISGVPPFGCQYGIQNVPVPLYKESVIDIVSSPCKSVCDLPASQRPSPVAFIINATHIPKPPVEDCSCYPPAGQDVMQTNLWHEINIPGVGLCSAHLSGELVVSRSAAIKDAVTGKCCINTRMVSMKLSGTDPLCGKVTITLNPGRASTGLICERVPGTCFPADSFFDIFIEVDTEKAGSFVNCDAAHMEAVITSLPPWNSFYNLSLEGLALYKLDPNRDVCAAIPRPAPAAAIGKALHVPRQPCSCFSSGTDTMNSTLIHDIKIPGLNKSCTAQFTGLVVVERGEPYLDSNGLCAVDTSMKLLDLTANDPACGLMKIHLNPDQPSGGYIRQLTRDGCFPAKSCFQVFIEVEVMGLVLRNCEPAIMCCEIGAIPPFGCAYQLNFGGDVSLWKAADCKLPSSQRPPPVGTIVQIQHVPQPITTGCPPGRPVYRRGDADGNNVLELTDGIVILSWLFTGGRAPRCFNAADASGQGQIDISSAVYLLQYLFLGGAAPPAPGPGACGCVADEQLLGPCDYQCSNGG